MIYAASVTKATTNDILDAVKESRERFAEQDVQD